MSQFYAQKHFYFLACAKETVQDSSAPKTLVTSINLNKNKSLEIESCEDLATTEMLNESSANILTSEEILNSPFIEEKNEYFRATEVQSPPFGTLTPLSVHDESLFTIAATASTLQDKGVKKIGMSNAEFLKDDVHCHNKINSSTAKNEIYDTFDAFASKFDKAAESNVSTSTIYDPFASGSIAMDTSSDGKIIMSK